MMGCGPSISASASGVFQTNFGDDVIVETPSLRGVGGHVAGSLPTSGNDADERILRDAALEHTAAATVLAAAPASNGECRTGNSNSAMSTSDNQSAKTIRVKRPLSAVVEAVTQPEVAVTVGRHDQMSADMDESRRDRKSRFWKVSNERLGRQVQYLDTRAPQNGEIIHQRPKLLPGELWTDTQFTCAIAMRSKVDEVLWRRPHEFCSDPQLIRNGTDRFDINQGQAGTCWILSVLASLAERPEIIQQIIPDDSYSIGTQCYDGVFHCKLWKLGQWNDVYVDDYLPICRETGQLWGAHSTDPDELWVSLIEKAFARFYGSYEAVYGGWAGDAFTTLTGGVAEKVKTSAVDLDYPVATPSELFIRVRNALSNGAIVSATVCATTDEAAEAGEDAALCGLVSGHAYTITAASTLEIDAENTYDLLRVRNPWGQGRGEWTGPWSDDSEQWRLVTDEVRQEMEIQFEPDGEFWMSLEDYCSHFSSTNICSLSPDFDKDGLDDGLCHVMTVLGEWRNNQTTLRNKMHNPRYVITIPDTGPRDGDGFTWVVLQLLQEQTTDHNLLAYCRLDFYQIIGECPSFGLDASGEDESSLTCTCLHELTNYTVYTASPGLCYRYRLLPGSYLVLPNYVTDKSPAEPDHTTRLFCIRVFAGVDITCREQVDRPRVFVQRTPTTVCIDRASCQLVNVQCLFGGWVSGLNAGGQISYPTLHLNPQYCIEISESTNDSRVHPLLIALIQESVEPIHSIGYFVYKVSPNSALPLDYRFMIKNFDQLVPNTLTDSYSFVKNCNEAHGVYLVEANRPYVIVAFADKPSDVKRYVIVLATQSHCRVECRYIE